MFFRRKPKERRPPRPFSRTLNWIVALFILYALAKGVQNPQNPLHQQVDSAVNEVKRVLPKPQEPPPELGPSLRSFSILKRPDDFQAPQKALEYLVHQQGKQELNHFCVIGYQLAADNQPACAYWEENNALILWAPMRGPAVLSLSRRFLDLDKDVVESDADVNGSTYVVSRRWANTVIDDCKKRGDAFVITKHLITKQTLDYMKAHGVE